jgi:hypothetical protein
MSACNGLPITADCLAALDAGDAMQKILVDLLSQLPGDAVSLPQWKAVERWSEASVHLQFALARAGVEFIPEVAA